MWVEDEPPYEHSICRLKTLSDFQGRSIQINLFDDDGDVRMDFFADSQEPSTKRDVLLAIKVSAEQAAIIAEALRCAVRLRRVADSP